MDTVLFPDQTWSAHISPNVGPPSYNFCEVTFQAPFSEGKLRYIDPPPPANETNAARCTIDMTMKDNIFVVTQTGCDLYCGHNAFFDGKYKRLP
jgi:hypothetical protein